MKWAIRLGYEPHDPSIDRKLRDIMLANGGKVCGCHEPLGMERELEYKFPTLAQAKAALEEVALVEDDVLLLARIEES